MGNTKTRKEELKRNLINGFHVIYHTTALALLYKSGALDVCVKYIASNLQKVYADSFLSSETFAGLFLATCVSIMLGIIVHVSMGELEEVEEYDEAEDFVYEDELELHHIRRKK